MSAESSVILYADDSEDDVMLMEHVLAGCGFKGTLMVMSHGLEVIDYLGGAGEYADRKKYPLPKAILLDVNMPRVNGIEVLRWIRRQESLRATPVLMLTSSDHPGDVKNAYAAKADGYLVKPVEIDAFKALVEDLLRFVEGAAPKIGPTCIRGAVPKQNP